MNNYTLNPEKMPKEGIEQFRLLWKAAVDAGALVKVEPKKKKEGGYPDGFEQLWGKVPHKIGKGNAAAAYKKALERGYTPLVIEKGIPTLVSSEKARQRASGSEYSPLHPATWLNGDRFLDEPGTNLSEPRKSKTDIAAEKCEAIMKIRVTGADKAALSACLSEGMTVKDIEERQYLHSEGKALSHFFYEVSELVNK